MYRLPLSDVEHRSVILANGLQCVLASCPRAVGGVVRLTFPVGTIHDSRAAAGLVSTLASVYGVERPNGHYPLPSTVELGYEDTHVDIAYATARGAVSELLRRVLAPFPDETAATELWYEAREKRARLPEDVRTDVRFANLLRRHHFTQGSTYSLPWPHGNRFELDPDKVPRPSYSALLLRWLRDYRPARARVTLLSPEPLDDLAAEVTRLSAWVGHRRTERGRLSSRQDLKPPWLSGYLHENATVTHEGIPAAVLAVSFPTAGASSQEAKYMDLVERFELGDVRVTTHRLKKASIVAFSVRVSPEPGPGVVLPSIAAGVLADTVCPILRGDADTVLPLARAAFATLSRDFGAIHRDPYVHMRALYPYLWPDPPPIPLVRAGVLRPRATVAQVVRLFRDRDHARVSLLHHPKVDMGPHLNARRLLCRAFGW